MPGGHKAPGPLGIMMATGMRAMGQLGHLGAPEPRSGHEGGGRLAPSRPKIARSRCLKFQKVGNMVPVPWSPERRRLNKAKLQGGSGPAAQAAFFPMNTRI